jgi:hypothetical protein
VSTVMRNSTACSGACCIGSCRRRNAVRQKTSEDN